ncbi:hypothetical protein DM02DRAFT_9443 [Periconia macrospinosa]|uniref:Uncharacterized protein n=1 Tax=Periconia macrospinosa TaxID=97972 RepID=A0A2V1EDQ6_9PLEO|nr:hypothetical protein DM02DRAFT_9443 [Periconia macrospinosa]
MDSTRHSGTFNHTSMISMSKSPQEIRQGAATSYQSCYWLWASGKTLKNRHWLLSLVTFGTFVSQALIIALSALFRQDAGYLDSIVKLERTLELRQIPYIRQFNQTSGYPAIFSWKAEGGLGSITDFYSNLSTNWMYTAEIRLTTNGNEPAWSKEGWSFVPVNLSDIGTMSRGQNDIGFNTEIATAHYSSVNVTLKTPAIRGRVICEPIQEVSTTKHWLSHVPMIDQATNVTTNVTGLSSIMFIDTPYVGGMTPDARYLSCCFNQTDSARIDSFFMTVAVGYWTEIWQTRTEPEQGLPFARVTGSTLNFTVKWVHGDGGFAELPEDYPRIGRNRQYNQSLLFFDPPQIQALSCMPPVESSEAEVVLDKETGRIQSYQLLTEPIPEESAWSDSFVFHDLTEPIDPAVKAKIAGGNRKNGGLNHVVRIMQNMTTSYGVNFMYAMLHASRLSSLRSPPNEIPAPQWDETLKDNVFNIRDNYTGLNLDFMSYASYIQANKDAASLLDANVLRQQTEHTFTTFFQHFVSSDVSLQSGGWAYQPIGANLDGLGKPRDTTPPQIAPNGEPAVPVSKLPTRDTEPHFNAKVAKQVEVLRMSPMAFVVCVVLLSWLLATLVVVAVSERLYFRGLIRNVESIADVLVLVAGSERFLELVREGDVQRLQTDQKIKTRLGPFRDSKGRVRRGIDIVEDGEILLEQN